MAAASDAVWAIDLGNNSLKALHLVAVGDAVQVIGFDHIPHGKILASAASAAEKEELVAITSAAVRPAQRPRLRPDHHLRAQPEQFRPVRDAAAGGSQAVARDRQIRGRPANPLRHERNPVGLSAYERSGQPGEEGRVVRDQERGGQLGDGVLRAGRPASQLRADGPHGPVQLSAVRPAGPGRLRQAGHRDRQHRSREHRSGRLHRLRASGNAAS